jgi:hypothetical protein
MNPPYSLTQLSIWRALVHFFEGGNIVLLIPDISLRAPIYKNIVVHISERNTLGEVKFVGFDEPLEKAVSLIYLLQPDMRARIHSINLKRRLGLRDDENDNNPK